MILKGCLNVIENVFVFFYLIIFSCIYFFMNVICSLCNYKSNYRKEIKFELF